MKVTRRAPSLIHSFYTRSSSRLSTPGEVQRQGDERRRLERREEKAKTLQSADGSSRQSRTSTFRGAEIAALKYRESTLSRQLKLLTRKGLLWIQTAEHAKTWGQSVPHAPVPRRYKRYIDMRISNLYVGVIDAPGTHCCYIQRGCRLQTRRRYLTNRASMPTVLPPQPLRHPPGSSACTYPCPPRPARRCARVWREV